MRDHPDCTCETEEIEAHTCPYAEEIADDYESMCNCCAHCYGECCMDI